MPLRKYMIAHKEKKYFHPQKTYCSFNKDFARLLILMQCINKLYLLSSVIAVVVEQRRYQAFAFWWSFRPRERESRIPVSVYVKRWYWSHSICYVQEAGRWWSHDIESYSALLALCEGNPPVIGGLPSQSASIAELWCFIWCTPEQHLSKLWSCRWFGMPWHKCDAVISTFV